MVEFMITATAADGSHATIRGSQTAIEAVERALKAGGAKWNPHVETWDFGFYDSTPKRAPLKLQGPRTKRVRS